MSAQEWSDAYLCPAPAGDDEPRTAETDRRDVEQERDEYAVRLVWRFRDVRRLMTDGYYEWQLSGLLGDEFVADLDVACAAPAPSHVPLCVDLVRRLCEGRQGVPSAIWAAVVERIAIDLDWYLDPFAKCDAFLRGSDWEGRSAVLARCAS